MKSLPPRLSIPRRERRRKDEFSSRQEVTGKDGVNLNAGLGLDDPEIKEIKDKAEAELKKLYEQRIKQSQDADPKE